ncbi:MAG: hypothetical protein U0N15_12260 [Bifidobacterium choerinum]
MNEKTTQKQYRFGRIKPNGMPALRLAAPIGLAVAIGMGVALWFAFPHPHDSARAWVGITVACTCLAPVMIALSWTLLVDRSTIPGAIAHPGHNVETSWYDQAAKDSFHLLLAGTGIGAAIASFCSSPTVSRTLAAVFVFTAVVFGISYLIHKVSGR